MASFHLALPSHSSAPSAPSAVPVLTQAQALAGQLHQVAAARQATRCVMCERPAAAGAVDVSSILAYVAQRAHQFSVNPTARVVACSAQCAQAFTSALVASVEQPSNGSGAPSSGTPIATERRYGMQQQQQQQRGGRRRGLSSPARPSSGRAAAGGVSKKQRNRDTLLLKPRRIATASASMKNGSSGSSSNTNNNKKKKTAIPETRMAVATVAALALDAVSPGPHPGQHALVGTTTLSPAAATTGPSPIPPRALATLPSKRHLLVLDTNTFLLQQGETLWDVLLHGQQFFTFILPEAVLRELDGLKQAAGNVGQRAREALRRIHAELTASADKYWEAKTVRAQAAHESCQAPGLPAAFARAVNVLNNDDRILDCALWYKQKHRECEIVLVTDDIGLSCKALANEVSTKKLPELLAALPPVREERQQAEQAAPATEAQPHDAVAASPQMMMNTQCNSVCDPPALGSGPVPEQLVERGEAAGEHSGEEVQLPNNVWEHIFGMCPPRQLPRIAQVSRSFHALSQNDRVWRASVLRMLGDHPDNFPGETPDEAELAAPGRFLTERDLNPRDWYLQWRRTTTPLSHLS